MGNSWSSVHWLADKLWLDRSFTQILWSVAPFFSKGTTQYNSFVDRRRTDLNWRQKKIDKLIKNDHKGSSLLWGRTCPLCVRVCWFVVGIHQGPGGQGSASSQTDDPADWLTFVGSNSWGEVVADWTGQTQETGWGGRKKGWRTFLRPAGDK